MQAGILYAALAYVMWGVFPIYFKALRHVPADQILVQRMLWSLGFVLLVLAWRRHWSWLAQAARRPRIVAGFAASALILSVNWFTYIWAVNSDHVLDASLGYFINPLVNVTLGYVFLHERLRPAQWTAVALAAAGVAWLTWQGGHPPWVALVLAVSFGAYGLLRKTAVLGALEGLTLETLALFPLAFGYLFILGGENSFVNGSASTRWLLAATGPITAVPLLLFAAGARRIPMSMLGLMQYITPTLQLLLGVWLYNEPFGGTRLVGFFLIWLALLVFSLEGLWRVWSARTSAA